jgi:hypothetical protein
VLLYVVARERIAMFLDVIALFLIAVLVPIIAVIVFISGAKPKRRRRPAQNFR